MLPRPTRSAPVVTDRGPSVPDHFRGIVAATRGADRIDGHDPFDHDQGRGSLSCRLYWAAGRVDGAPGVEEVIAAIARAQCQV